MLRKERPFVNVACGLMFVITLSHPSHGLGDSPAGVATKADEKIAPPLSLESLFHPQRKFDYDGQVPATHWLDDSPSRLLIKRESGWKQVNLASGKESAPDFIEQLAARLEMLDGVDKKRATSSASGVASSMKRSTDPVLVRLGKSLVVVSTSTPAKRLTQDATKWGNATLDPTGRRLAYTQDGDLFLVDIATQRSMRMTQDNTETLLDGVLDWTYQEEIFGRGNFRGFWFSPNGESLAMLRIDTSGIEPYTLGSSDAARGQSDVSRYPKAGDPIPHASLVVWNLERFDAGVVAQAKLIEQSTESQQRIITGVWWHEHRRRLLYSVSDRVQSWRELRYVDDPFLDGTFTESKLLLREASPAWVEPPATPSFLSDGGLVWRSELPTGRYRLYRISADGSTVIPMSPDSLSIREFSVQPDGIAALVTADAETRTVAQHLYRFDARTPVSGDFDANSLVSLTTRSGWHDVSTSPDGAYFTDVHSDASTPPAVTLHSTLASSHLRIELHQPQLKLEGALFQPEFIRIENRQGGDFPGMVVRPKADDANPTRLPVVIETYGGPQSPVVSNRWPGTQSLYRELLAREGIATLVVDNRSSAGRGLVDTWSIHKQFGKVEMEDLLATVAWLEQQSWVDPDRIAIRGWSYGGYMTLYALTHSDAFAAGIAGGSVTDFREYDAFYTERYMGLPSENIDGYAGTDLPSVAAKLHGRLLMIHGEVDDNVHPLGTLRMAKALQMAGKQFDMMIYPSNAHSVHNPAQLWHMVNLTDTFLKEALE